MAKLIYVLTDNQFQKPEIGKEYYVTAHNSTVCEYIIINQLFEDSVYFKVDQFLAHQISLIGPCAKFNLFQKLALLLGANREKLDLKAKKIDIYQNPFLKLIQSHK